MGNVRRRFAGCPSRALAFCVLLVVLPLLCGCHEDSNLGSVSGIVRIDGKPLETGTVRFVPEAGRAATGKINSNGTYTLGTFGTNDGALLGTHKVAIVAVAAGGDGRPAYEARTQVSKSLVPDRYLAVGTSGLSFEVKPGDNEANFDLTSK